MKRIFYGPLTIDVHDAFAEQLGQWVEELANRSYRLTPGYSNQPSLWKGRDQRFYSIPGYVNDATEPTVVTVLIGSGHDLAIAPTPRNLPDAPGTIEATAELASWNSPEPE